MFSLKSTYKRYTVKIPQNVLVIYSESEGHILLKNKCNKVIFIRILFRLLWLNHNTFQVISEVRGNNTISQKEIKKHFNTQVSLLKQSLQDISSQQYKKIIFVGLGYKFFLIKNNFRLLQLKLGYSHDIFVKVPSSIDLKWYNQNSIYVSGTSTTTLSSFSNKIKAYRIPDTYLGKGILFVNEKITLKKGKQA